MKIRRIMSENVACCMEDTPLSEVARMMVDCDCGEIPVVDSLQSRRLRGVVTDRDIVCRTLAQGKNPLEMTAGQCMTSPAVTVTSDMSVDECCRVLEDHQIRRVPVVDEQGV